MELKLAFIALTIFTNAFLILIGCKAINDTSQHPNKDKTFLILGLIIWQTFIFSISSTGMLKAFIIPSFIFTGLFLYKERSSLWLERISESTIIYFQSFRILVEILFVLSVTKGIFNYHVTIEGYNYDMLFASTAPLIAYLVYNKKILPRRSILIWNYLGLFVLASVIFVYLTSVYKPEIYGSQSPLLPLAALTYPYVLIAGFLMPVAVFLHILSILQVRKK